MAGTYNLLSQCTPVRNDQKVPQGHIVVATAWQGTEVADKLSRLISVDYAEGLGVADFHPSSEAAVLFISEAELVSGANYKRRLVKFKQGNTSLRGIVIAQRTHITMEHYSKLQRLSVELGLSIIPIETIEELCQLLAQLVMCEGKAQLNQFRMKPKAKKTIDVLVLEAAMTVPMLGQKKALLLLKKFGSLHAIAIAPENSLAEVVGVSTAASVYKFFHSYNI
ncbi:Fanconi anemia core complex-associated protein 24-like [Oratosquilla oratoria]|uniref:Fanconi anemia core complex-associated protein 24-like n=1 Tax=Oratosquilla oratoria TaxID=337810 RepID=UPI003F7738F1